MPTIDLNADVGESFGPWTLGDDAALLRSVSSANVACGFHAGDPRVMRETCAAAAAAGVAVGAHPGYRDLAGFGRRNLDIAPDDLRDDIVYQLGALRAVAHASGTEMRYVKPHGALYNTIVHDSAQAGAVVDAILAVDPQLPILALPGSVIARMSSAAGLRVVTEAFADRAYAPDGTLTPRRLPGSVLHSETEVVEQVLSLVLEGVVRATDGSRVRVDAQSVCLHGDTPGAVEFAAAVRAELIAAGVTVESFVRS